MSTSEIWKGDGNPAERAGSFEVYTDTEDHSGYHELSVFDDAYPMAMYGHYRPDKQDDYMSLAWSTTADGASARATLLSYAGHRPGKPTQYQTVTSEPDGALVTRTGKRVFESTLPDRLRGLQVVKCDYFMQWVHTGQPLREDYPQLNQPFYRIWIPASDASDWLSQVVIETILSDYQATALETFHMLQATFRKYRTYAH